MKLIPCRLSQMLIEERSDSQVIFISEIDGDRRIPIMIGPLEAMAIERALKKQEFPRPLTHDLLVDVIAELQCTCIAVRITAFKSGTFFAELVISKNQEDGLESNQEGNKESNKESSQKSSQEYTIDCRPSDAIALLVRLNDVPLYIADAVFADAEL